MTRSWRVSRRGEPLDVRWGARCTDDGRNERSRIGFPDMEIRAGETHTSAAREELTVSQSGNNRGVGYDFSEDER